MMKWQIVTALVGILVGFSCFGAYMAFKQPEDRQKRDQFFLGIAAVSFLGAVAVFVLILYIYTEDDHQTNGLKPFYMILDYIRDVGGDKGEAEFKTKLTAFMQNHSAPSKDNSKIKFRTEIGKIFGIGSGVLGTELELSSAS